MRFLVAWPHSITPEFSHAECVCVSARAIAILLLLMSLSLRMNTWIEKQLNRIHSVTKIILKNTSHRINAFDWRDWYSYHIKHFFVLNFTNNFWLSWNNLNTSWNMHDLFISFFFYAENFNCCGWHGFYQEKCISMELLQINSFRWISLNWNWNCFFIEIYFNSCIHFFFLENQWFQLPFVAKKSAALNFKYILFRPYYIQIYWLNSMQIEADGRWHSVFVCWNQECRSSGLDWILLT